MEALKAELSAILANPLGNVMPRSGHRKHTPAQTARVAEIKRELRRLGKEGERAVDELEAMFAGMMMGGRRRTVHRKHRHRKTQRRH